MLTNGVIIPLMEMGSKGGVGWGMLGVAVVTFRGDA